MLNTKEDIWKKMGNQTVDGSIDLHSMENNWNTFFCPNIFSHLLYVDWTIYQLLFVHFISFNWQLCHNCSYHIWQIVADIYFCKCNS